MGCPGCAPTPATSPANWPTPPSHTVCAALRRRLPGYATATPDTLQRRFLSTAGEIHNHNNEIIVRLDRRIYSPVLRQADLPTTEVPWWHGRRLRYQYR
ncbi:MAG: hypothetical protein WCG47_14380 [Dermatophilaceae bacterium]